MFSDAIKNLLVFLFDLQSIRVEVSFTLTDGSKWLMDFDADKDSTDVLCSKEERGEGMDVDGKREEEGEEGERNGEEGSGLGHGEGGEGFGSCSSGGVKGKGRGKGRGKRKGKGKRNEKEGGGEVHKSEHNKKKEIKWGVSNFPIFFWLFFGRDCRLILQKELMLISQDLLSFPLSLFFLSLFLSLYLNFHKFYFD